MRLEAVAGQPRAVEQLSRALEGGRVAHAYAFVGPAGAGRFTTALAFASELLADDAPQAFLKFLEEPPPATVVILILPRARAVPATVISRCQIVLFRARRAAAAGGAMVADAVAWIEETRTQGVTALFKRSERVDRERAETLIDGCWLHCRDLVLARAGAPPALLTDPARAEALAAEAARWSDDTALYRAIEACREARLALVKRHPAPDGRHAAGPGGAEGGIAPGGSST